MQNTHTARVARSMPVRVAVMALVAVVGLHARAGAQPIKTRLAFPIQGTSPYSAAITSMLDHDQNKWGKDSSGRDVKISRGTLVSWLGERARNGVDGKAKIYNSDLPQILGFGGDGVLYPKRAFQARPADQNFMSYENSNGYEHPGYDYGGTSGKIIVAPATGTLYIVGVDPLLGETWGKPTDGSAKKGYHAFRIDHGGGLSTWFLHATRFVNPQDPGNPGDWDGLVKSKISADAYAGKVAIKGEVEVGRVRKDEPIALVGGYPSFAAHVHMEVRLRNAQGIDTLIDPYGWEGDASDPLDKNPGQILWEGYDAPVATAAYYNPLAKTIAVVGSSFTHGVKVEIWRRFELNRTERANQRDGTYVGSCTSTGVGMEQILGQGCPALASLDDYVVKVLRPDSKAPTRGPRSRAVKINSPSPEVAARMVSPSPSSVLAGGSVLQWSAGSSVRQYWLEICCFADGRKVYPRASQSLKTTFTLPTTGLPEDGRALTLTLQTEFLSGRSQSTSYAYQAPQRGNRWEVRVFNSDDIGRVRVNGTLVPSLTTYFRQDTGFQDITARLRPGANRLVFEIENSGGGMAYGFQVRKNGALFPTQSCGTAGVVGCDGNRVFPSGFVRTFFLDIVK